MRRWVGVAVALGHDEAMIRATGTAGSGEVTYSWICCARTISKRSLARLLHPGPLVHTPNGLTQPTGRALRRVVHKAHTASHDRRARAGTLIKGNWT